MWQRFVDLIRRLFGKRPEKTTREEEVASKYEVGAENITATIANKLAKLTFGDSTIDITGTGKRVELITDVLMHFWDDDAKWVTAQAFGKGGKVIVPTVAGGKVVLNIADQSRLFVSEMRGKRIASATLLADIVRLDEQGVAYYRWVDYTLAEDGTQLIRTRATMDSGASVPLASVPEWADITEEITISGTDRLLLALLRCPRDSRTDRRVYGVPITYGAERDVGELVEHLGIYRREYRLTRPMLGLDATLWRSKTDFSDTPMGIDAVRKTVQDGDDPFIPVQKTALDGKDGWSYYAPAIRSEAMETRLNSLNRRVERACGLSQGILTERSTTNYANRDEVRASMYDTFCTVQEMRENLEAAIADIAYSVDVLAERFGLSPAGARGAYEIAYDWDASLIEASAETFTQLSELQSRGMVSKAELRQWVKGGTLEEAQVAIDEMEPAASPIDQALSEDEE